MIENLQKSKKLQELHHALQEQESILIEELWDAPKALVAALAQQATGKHILILTGASQEESRLYHDLPFFTERPVVDFPAWETLPTEKIPPSPDIVGERYQVLSAIVEKSQPQIIISSLHACLQKLIPPKKFNVLYLTLKVGATLPYDTLIERLNNMGYQRCPVAADKGEFAVRGGIIDIFPVSSPEPIRIEFWGDDIESLRTFDPIGQKSITPLDHAEITPAQEMEFLGGEDSLSTILDYLGNNALVIFDDLLALEDRYASLIHIFGKPTQSFGSLESFLDDVSPLQKIFLPKQPIEELSKITLLEKQRGGFYSENAPMHKLSFQIFNREHIAKRWANPFVPITQYLLPEKPPEEPISGDEILASLSKLAGKDFSLHFLCSTDSEESSLQKTILERQINLPKETSYHLGYLSNGFVMHDTKCIILPMAEITQRYKIRRQKLRSTYHTAPSEVYDLTPGEMVVHLNNGIGRFLGIEKRPNNVGIESEFMLVEYADNAKLYVPMNQAHLISKYIGTSDDIPKMHTLGSNRWKRTKENTERAILGYASELLQLYAKREMKGGFAYPEDSPDILAFDEEFPFVETEDQLLALASIRRDMLSQKAMDRLVCGDVGYGKTEIAMRAAFKAILDGGKQVAMLVPTTILAMQHYENFLDRMRSFPVNIAVLSRFRSSKQMRKTLEDIANGTVDIVIGTHRLISKDVHFKNLGLVIVDEEQRFGVRAKEHLKKIKTGVDCLTLSATPIPRTLYMSLIGARDMSVINTPPQDRLPIKTIIADPSDELIKNAILRELARDGQTFVIHNRIETIHGVADRIKKLLPQARVAVGHGQMHSSEINEVFHAFKNGLIDILVATTIVENGIDIPNANTILIDRADQFGLADLYQLRGRVGRWNRRAYAYFLVPRLRALPEVSRKRLNALAESSGYGGGMKLAMRDLEIRGAGDILGIEQSGHVSAIGFHLYCKLLKKTVKSLEGKRPVFLTETKIDFPIDARLPEDYVNETSLRMEIYQRLGEAASWDEVDDILNELKDRFGPPPDPVLWLYHATRIKVHASLYGYTLLKLEKYTLTAEKRKGKKAITQRVPIKKIHSPQDLEEKVLAALKNI
ncbi:MAG: Transcription-repair-coupling factor [Chlamydiae bacterium]|nr:Transcription-repair-coupling factor [Chlamydiota bacterium]